MGRGRLITGIMIIVLGLGGLLFGVYASVGKSEIASARREHGWRLTQADHRELARIEAGAQGLSTAALVLGGVFVVGGIVVLSTGRRDPTAVEVT